MHISLHCVWNPCRGSEVDDWRIKNSVMDYIVFASNMVWKQRYISDDQWQQVYWEFLNCCSLVWKHPIQSAAFLFCCPWLIKILMFFYPLVITTILFLLIRFSLGPQLERMRVDRDIQWHRFKEAAVGDEDSSGGSWTFRKPCGKLDISRGVDRNIANGGGDWVEWTESLEEVDRSFVFTEKDPRDSIEIYDMKVDFHKGTEEEKEQDTGPMGVSSKSLILGKVRELMERLIDELGGRVEIDGLNALESISQILMESTGRDYQYLGKYSHPFPTRKIECELSDDSTPYSDSLNHENLEDSSLNHENLEDLRDDVKEGKNSSFLAMAEAEHKKPDCRQSPTTGYVGDSHCFTELEINSQTVEDLEATKGSKDEQEQGKNPIFLPKDDVLSEDGQATGHVADREFRFSTDSENSLGTCEKQDDAAPSYQYQEQWGESLDFVEANLSRSQDVRTSSPVQDREQRVEGLSGLEHCKLRSYGSLSVEALINDFRCMDQSPEIDKGNCLKQIFSDKCNRDHHYTPVRNPQHISKQPCVLDGKLRSYPSITSVKSPQFSASPVVLRQTEEMDLLWEQYNDASQTRMSARKEPIADLDDDLSEMVVSDAEDQKEPSQICCLQAFKLSKGRMPLKKPNLKKFSKALKKLSLLATFSRSKKAQI